MRCLSPILLPLLALAGLWDLAPFLWARVREDPQLGLLHGVLAIGLLSWWCPRKRQTHTDPVFWRISLGFLLLQSVSAPFLPWPLIRSLLAALSLASALLLSLPQARQVWPAIYGCCLLLPFSEASAAFFLGYPARVLASSLAATLLRISGSSVLQQGSLLTVQGEPLFVDAPCAGLSMGWTGLAICALFCLYQQTPPRRSLLCAFFAPILILIGNVLRLCSLAHVQQFQTLSETTGLHSAVGMVSFLLLLPLLYLLAGPAQKLEPPHREHAVPPLHLGLITTLVILSPAFSFQSSPSFSGDTHSFTWPTKLDDQVLTPVPLTELDQRFPRKFPGLTARFKTDSSAVLLRWVHQPTRLLHASATCYQAGGYTLKPLPGYQDAKGRLWSRYRVRYGTTDLVIREHIRSLSSDASWPEVTAWYWAALRNQDAGPWLAITVAEPWPQAAEQ